MERPDMICVYCGQPARLHDPMKGGGAVWLQCRDGTERPVHLDVHFRNPPGWTWAGQPNSDRRGIFL